MSKTSRRVVSADSKVSPNDALDILSSALNYCADAGLYYWLANGTKGEGLLIRLPRVLVSDDGERLMTKSESEMTPGQW
jgi:hypothetical protein